MMRTRVLESRMNHEELFPSLEYISPGTRCKCKSKILDMGEAYVSYSQCCDFLTVLKLNLFNLQIYFPQSVSSGEFPL